MLTERANAVYINFKNITVKEETTKTEQKTAKQLKKTLASNISKLQLR